MEFTSIVRWEYESRKLLEKAINKRIDEALHECLSNVKKEEVARAVLSAMGRAREQISKDLDLFKIQRVRFRHDVIFWGNKNKEI